MIVCALPNGSFVYTGYALACIDLFSWPPPDVGPVLHTRVEGINVIFGAVYKQFPSTLLSPSTTLRCFIPHFHCFPLLSLHVQVATPVHDLPHLWTRVNAFTAVSTGIIVHG